MTYLIFIAALVAMLIGHELWSVWRDRKVRYDKPESVDMLLGRAVTILEGFQDHDMLTLEANEKVRTWLRGWQKLPKSIALRRARSLIDSIHYGDALCGGRQFTTEQADEIHRWFDDQVNPGINWKRLVSWERMVTSVMLALLLAVICSVVRSNFTTYEVAEPQSQPGIASEVPLYPTTLQQVDKDFGPFKTISVFIDGLPTPTTNAPALLLLGDDGGTMASTKWTLDVNSPEWRFDGSFWVRNVLIETNDIVRIQTASNYVYLFSVNQPFVLAEAPDAVIRIDAQGTVSTIPLAQAVRLRVTLDK
jgi:hypothetical protein